jgi:hypothetical protein
MLYFRNNTASSTRFTIFTFILIALFFSSCSKSLKFLPSTVVPGAEGKVKVKQDKNRNYAIALNIRNLADPSRLETPKSNYVVWMETVDNGTQNLGRLSNSKGLFSKSNKGSLETVTPYWPLRFFITAEEQADIQYPGDQVVLRSENNDK